MKDLIDEVDALYAKIGKGKARNVNDRATKDSVVALGSKYFTAMRPRILQSVGESDGMREHDALWQDLITLAQGNNSRKSYRELIRSVRKGLVGFNVLMLTRVADQEVAKSGATNWAGSEEQIVSTLDKVLASAGASYRQGVLDLRDRERLSYRGTASEFREALREVLDYLAPDADVMKQSWYKPVENRTKPTMKQQVKFILESRGQPKVQRESVEKTVELVESFIADLTRTTYDRASLATHVETSRAEVSKIRRYVDALFHELLEIPE